MANPLNPLDGIVVPRRARPRGRFERRPVDEKRRPAPTGVKETWGGPTFSCRARGRRIRRAFVFAALCVLAGARPARAAPLELAVARTPLSLPLYVAEAEGYFGDEGLTTTMADCIGGHRCLQRVLDGQADVGTASDSPVMFRSFERSDYVVIGTFVTTSDDVKLVGRRSAGITRPGDLRGKKVGVVRGASSHYFLDSVLLLNGIDPRSVTLVGLQPDEMAAALQSGTVAAVSVWEPFAFDTLRAVKGDAIVLPNAGAYSLSFNLVVQRRAVGTRDAELVKLLRAVRRAEIFIRNKPSEAQAILRKRLGVDQAFIDWVWPGMRFQLTLEQSLIKTLESQARWAIREGHVGGKAVPNYLRYVHPLPLREADANAVSLSD